MDCFHQVIPFIYESSDSKLFLYGPVFMECMDMLENRVIRKNFVHRAARILVFSPNPGWVFERTTVLDLRNLSSCYAHRKARHGCLSSVVQPTFPWTFVSQPEPFRFQVHDHSSSLSAPSSDSFTIQNTAPRSFFSQRPSAR